MICAPCAAAWRTSCSALAILAWRSQLQLIWVAATVTRRGMAFSGKKDHGYSITHDPLTGSDVPLLFYPLLRKGVIQTGLHHRLRGDPQIGVVLRGVCRPVQPLDGGIAGAGEVGPHGAHGVGNDHVVGIPARMVHEEPFRRRSVAADRVRQA